jgi:hypothetical protein
MPDPLYRGQPASRLEATIRARLRSWARAGTARTAQAPEIIADVCYERLGSHRAAWPGLAAAWRRGPQPREVAIEDQVLAALDGQDLPVATDAIVQMTGLDDCPGAVWQVLCHLERLAHVERFTVPGGARRHYWRRLIPPVSSPPG